MCLARARNLYHGDAPAITCFGDSTQRSTNFSLRATLLLFKAISRLLPKHCSHPLAKKSFFQSLMVLLTMDSSLDFAFPSHFTFFFGKASLSYRNNFCHKSANPNGLLLYARTSSPQQKERKLYVIAQQQRDWTTNVLQRRAIPVAQKNWRKTAERAGPFRYPINLVVRVLRLREVGLGWKTCLTDP